jgi:thiol-disulfide isomerase/thioredoxin
MKKLIIIICISMLLSANTNLCAEGMKFFEGTWKEVLAEAKAKNKPIFIDIYTTWCGPCKQMSKNIFPQDKVGEKFNTLFINYKIDAEKGEGIDLAKKYGVDAYPTYLFVDANENLFYKSIGSMPEEKFLAEADLAIAESKSEKSIMIWDKEYANGKRDVAFLKEYISKRSKMRMNSVEILEEYIKTQTEESLSSDENLNLLMDNVASVESKAFETLMKNKAKITEVRGDRRAVTFTMKMAQAVQRSIGKAIKNQDKALLEKCVEANKQIYSNPMMVRFADKANAEAYMKYYKGIKDKENYLKTATDFIEKNAMAKSLESIKKIDEGNYERFMQVYKMGMMDSTKDERFQEMKKMMSNMEARNNAVELNNAAFGVVELFDDKATLEKVSPWLERALELLREPFVLDSYAHLLFKLGKKKEAIQAQKEAIEKATTAKEDAESIAKYKEYLQEIEK